MTTSCFSANAVARHQLCGGLRKKWCLSELNPELGITSTISRMRTRHMRMWRSCRTDLEPTQNTGTAQEFSWIRGISSIPSLMPPPSSSSNPTATMTPFELKKLKIWPGLRSIPLVSFDLSFYFQLLFICICNTTTTTLNKWHWYPWSKDLLVLIIFFL